MMKTDMKSLLVTVIIPNYCHAKYLDQRIQSVLCQTYQNFEIIILDDCSPDNGASKAVIEKYRGNSHVSHILYNDENCGSTFRQWQKGFDLAKGEYIWIAESDDSCDGRLLETFVTLLQNDDQCSLAFCRSMTIDTDGIMTGIYPTQKDKEKVIQLPGKVFIAENMVFTNLICNASSAVFRKQALEQIPNDYTHYKACGDWLFWIYISECGNVCYTPKVLNHFRIHDTNTTQKHIKDGVSVHETLLVLNYLRSKSYMKKREMLKWKIKGYHFHKYDYDVKQFRKEWGITPSIWLCAKYDHIIDKIIKLFQKMII